MNKLACFKTHYSIGRSILTAEKPSGNLEKSQISVFDLVLDAKLNHLCVVEDGMTGFLQLAENCTKNNLKLIYGLRVDVTENALAQDEVSLKKRAKYVIFAKNNVGYKTLIKIWSFAAKEGFYYNPCLDFKHLKALWNDNLMLAVPFYDSFLHQNAFEGHVHIPEFDTIKPVFLLESNELPFDAHLRQKVLDYSSTNGFDTVEAQSIFYKSKRDFVAYMTFKCINNRTDIEKPELNHFGSDTFNYERWLKNEQGT
jgi:DNA polymerase III alpha subunit